MRADRLARLFSSDPVSASRQRFIGKQSDGVASQDEWPPAQDSIRKSASDRPLLARLAQPAGAPCADRPSVRPALQRRGVVAGLVVLALWEVRGPSGGPKEGEGSRLLSR